MQTTPETIYESLFVQGRGGLGRELARCLRSGREAGREGGPSHILGSVVISELPAEAEDRAVPRHWALGTGKAAWSWA